ncbi:pimeloyl-ACP methyl ester carboxylesterase [Herbihabitans rhizosphaerae]|uniref:Pimeloyl-ACP methyl ester carboxylesterase n=1 Tax=Herbihabitans rhizosphaerae TaxID=1872711 RepID=A0A4Q7KFT0_9PSEU|nr:alpha/beta hydrolase [Herbihabitans rhizosphaerae]RZS32742.1 pimeloyl-ACP methyl ester carboxylesterase [Herbihabitans rhizosphaerae]
MPASAHVIGDGAHKVIALNGWFTDRTGYDRLWPYLDTGAFGYAFFDYRGYGSRLEVGGEFTREEIAADVLALADELGWSEFSLVGHSMAGVYIQQVLATAPDQVRALVGVNPVPTNFEFDADGAALFSSSVEETANRRVIIDFVTGNRLSGTWLNQMAARSVERSTKEAFGAYLTQWTGAAIEIPQVDLPVKVIIGEHDPALPEALMRDTWLSAYSNVELEIMLNAGHYPMDETPLALVTSIEAFLRGI